MDKEKLRQISNKYLEQGLKKKNLDSKLEHIDYAIQADNENDEAWYHKAHLFCKKSNYEDANKCYTKALEINPKNGTVYYEKGNVLIKLNKYDEAYNCYDEALKINPKNSNAYYGKECALIKSTKYDEIIKFYNEALRINPNNEKALYKLGCALYKVGKNKEAIDCYIKLLEIYPENEILGNYESYDYNSYALFKLGKYEDSIKYCDKFLEKNPKNDVVWNYKGYSLSKLGRYDGAIECYKKSLEIKPEDENAWYNIGYTLYKLSKYEDALKYFQRTLKINSKDAYAWEYQGKAFFKLGKYLDAIKCYDKFIELDPESLEALKNREEAIYLYNELTKRNINNLEISKNQIKYNLNNIIYADAYLIYSDKMDFLNKLNEHEIFLLGLKQKKEIFEKYFNDLVETSINEVIASRITIENFNKELIERRKKEYDFLFKKSTFDLDNEQKTAIITDDKHNLVVAGAGSGKTEILITRIAYLVERKIEPSRILVLAFNKKAIVEIKDRLSKRFGIEEVKIQTFHSFGYEVRSNSELKTLNDTEYHEFIAELYKKSEKEPSFQKKILTYMLHFGNEEIKQESDFETKNEWYQYMQDLTYTTLSCQKVRSEGERSIYNFLFTHKINETFINFLYEHPAKWMNYANKKGVIDTPEPDFFLPEYNIYIEHWGIDELGNVPEWFEPNYMKYMHVKIFKFEQQKKYSLIETNYGEFKNDNFINNFKNKLITEIRRKCPDKDFVLTEMGNSEIVERVWKSCKESIERNPRDIAKFITKAKTNGLTPKNIVERLEKEIWSSKQKAFAELALVIYEEYEKELRRTNKIDFSDMINQAIMELETNKSLYENSFDHILIDEYQDISRQRYLLIKALMAKNRNCKLFCVGDDWQSITGYAGSNLELFVKFEEYFDHPARTDLSINYRSIKSIVDAGAELIKYNGDGQLQKQTIANNDHEQKIRIFSYSHPNTSVYRRIIAEHCVNMVKEYQMKGISPQDIIILYRAKYNRNIEMFNWFNEYAKSNNVNINEDSKSPHVSRLMNVHQSKGLQAKVVFILCVDKGLYGFPSEIEDPTIFEPAMHVKIVNKEAEERRLFYVAITRSIKDLIIYTQKGNESKFLDEIQAVS